MTVYVVSQHYFPDETSTADCMTAIAEELARDYVVVAISGTSGSATNCSGDNPSVIEIHGKVPPKHALVRRALAMLLFSVRAFASVARRAKRSDIVVVITTPFLAPYFVVFAARLRRAKSILIVHDVYPEALIASGIIGPNSLVARAIRLVAGIVLRRLDAIVIIGRDAETLLLRYPGVMRDKITIIPHWATLQPGARVLDDHNPFRRSLSPSQFVVGLSGNLGFMHDPAIVFEAARRMVGDSGVHFLLSGSGVGWDWLKATQLQAKLPNVTLQDWVLASSSSFVDFQAAANLWIIPYRKSSFGVSVPSRFYNLIAVGRPVIAVAEENTEVAQTLLTEDIGWVVPPGDSAALVETIRAAAREPAVVVAKGHRAATVATRYTRSASLASYRNLVRRLADQEPEEQKDAR